MRAKGAGCPEEGEMRVVGIGCPEEAEMRAGGVWGSDEESMRPVVPEKPRMLVAHRTDQQDVGWVGQLPLGRAAQGLALDIGGFW